MNTDIYYRIKLILQYYGVSFLWQFCFFISKTEKHTPEKQLLFPNSPQLKSFPDTQRSFKSSIKKLKEGISYIVFLKALAKCMNQVCFGQNSNLDVPGW